MPAPAKARKVSESIVKTPFVMTQKKISIALLLILSLAIAGCQGLGGEPTIISTVPPSSVESVNAADAEIAAVMTLGGDVWAENCARCHGQMGEGTSDGIPLPDLTNRTDEQILASINGGTIADSGLEMPAFSETLTAEQIEAVATFAKMMSKAISSSMIQAQPTAASEAQAAVTGIVTGQVTNGTAGANVPADLPVTLHVIKSQVAEDQQEGAINADGTFRFENVPINAAYHYVVTAPYNGIQFVSSISVGGETTEIDLPLMIYEGGADASAVQISGISAQTIVQNGRLQVVEIVSFVNTSDRVYTTQNGSQVTSVSLRAPAGVQFQSGMGANFVLSEDATQVWDTRPLVPGASHIMHAAYSLPYIEGAAVEQPLDYPLVGRVEMQMAVEGLSLTADGMTALAATSSGLPRYGGDFEQPTGASLRFAVSGSPVAAAVNQTATGETAPLNTAAYLLIGGGAAALIIAIALLIRERRQSQHKGKDAIGTLMEQIAQLDAQHDEGKLKEREYQRQRAALKTQLSALMKAQ